MGKWYAHSHHGAANFYEGSNYVSVILPPELFLDSLGVQINEGASGQHVDCLTPFGSLGIRIHVAQGVVNGKPAR